MDPQRWVSGELEEDLMNVITEGEILLWGSGASDTLQENGTFFCVVVSHDFFYLQKKGRLPFRHLFSSNESNSLLNEGLGKLFKGVLEVVI